MLQRNVGVVTRSGWRLGELSSALAMLDEMKEAGIAPDTWTYNSVIKACNQVSVQHIADDRASDRKSAQTSEKMLTAFEVLAKMKAEGVSHSVLNRSLSFGCRSLRTT